MSEQDEAARQQLIARAEAIQQQTQQCKAHHFGPNDDPDKTYHRCPRK